MGRWFLVLSFVLCLTAAERLHKLWQVNLGPVPPPRATVSISVCRDGSTIVGEAGAPLIRVDPGGTVRSTDWIIGNSVLICTENGFAELESRRVTVWRWAGGRTEYTLPSAAFNGIELPNSGLLVLTGEGPMLLSAGDARPIATWGAVTPDLPEAFLALRRDLLAVVYPKRIVFHDSVSLRPMNISILPVSRTDRDPYIGAAFLADGRLVTQSRNTLVLLDPLKGGRSEMPVSRGLLHGAGADGCLVFSAFHPDTGKVLRKLCLASSE